ncbi:MAG: glycosyltransferase family 2 protein [Chloroflexota bacterium]
MAIETLFPQPTNTRQTRPLPDGSSATVDVSIVIPLLNEAENLERLYDGLNRALSQIDRTCEIILIDDGSTDDSFLILKALAERDERVRVARLRRNFGQTAAFAAGFDMARGDVIITMDADCQNDPADIPLLLDKMEEGYDIVSGWRVHRHDAFLKRKLPSRAANALISRLTGVKLHDYGCSLKAYRREVVKNIRLYGELHRFIPALASWMGVRVAEVPVHHAPRTYGKSKYGLSRVVKVILDLLAVKFLLNYATRPIQIFGLLGSLCFGLGTATGAYLTYAKLVLAEPLADRPLLLLAVLLVVLGVQLIVLGLLGEVVMRTYFEAQNKSVYAVREVLEGSQLAAGREPAGWQGTAG